jgi:putative transposase
VKRGSSRRAETDAALTAQIHAAHVLSLGTYGAPRVHAELAAKGLRVGRKLEKLENPCNNVIPCILT